MAVFTPVAAPDLADLLVELRVGTLVTLQGIDAGIENTNYSVDTTSGRWVLTLFERLAPEQLPFYLGLMQHLAQRGLPVAEPCANAQGRLLHRVRGKPAALVQRLPGRHLLAPDTHHCAQLGQVLARMHQAVVDFKIKQPNLRGVDWCGATAPQVLPYLGTDAQGMLRDELAFQQQVLASPLWTQAPKGAVHADLFRDNVLFDGLPDHERLTGCLDFYFAGVDAFVYDLAVCLNDWCAGPDAAGLDDTRAQALVKAYRRERGLTGAELRLLPAMMRRAALRFWLSRLADWHLPRDAQLLTPKDPSHFDRVLRARRDQPWHPD